MLSDVYTFVTFGWFMFCFCVGWLPPSSGFGVKKTTSLVSESSKNELHRMTSVRGQTAGVASFDNAVLLLIV